jgi:hypothetical protein
MWAQQNAVSRGITGRLTDAAGRPAPDYSVVLFPANRSYWIAESRRIAAARPGADGTFAFGGPGPVSIPAGEYLLAVVPDLAPNEQYETSLLATLVDAAVRVTLTQGQRVEQHLRVK